MKTFTFNIKKEYKSIYLFLKQNGFSENYISNLRKSWGNIIVNDQIVNIRQHIYSGDKLQINSSPNAKTTIMQNRLPLDIVYEDDYYLLINKNSGISTMPNKSHYDNNLAGAICNYMAEKDEDFVLRISNRLDKETSGIVIVAKDSISLKELGEVKKTYYAICEGVIKEPICINEKIATLTENGINNIRRIVSPSGKDAVTNVVPIKNNGKQTLCKITLEHGRTHQIRVHMSHIGYPLCSDSLYGTTSPLINRTSLHCKEVSFYHYIKKEMIHIETPLPKDFFIT